MGSPVGTTIRGGADGDSPLEDRHLPFSVNGSSSVVNCDEDLVG